MLQIAAEEIATGVSPFLLPPDVINWVYLNRKWGKPMKIGIQVSSLKPLLLDAAQVKAAFAKLRDLGCGVVQLQWIDPSVPPEVIAEAAEGL